VQDNYNRAQEVEEQNIYNDNFRNQFPPAEIGRQTYNRAAARNLEQARITSQQTQSSYADMYNQNRLQNYNTSMMGAPQGLTGGMATQYDTAVSSAQMQAANRLGVQQERSLRDIELNRIAQDRTAVQEGFMAEDRARQGTAYDMQMEQQRQAILASDEMSDEQKTRMLMASGMDYATAASQVNPQGTQEGLMTRLGQGEVNPVAGAIGAVSTAGLAYTAVRSLPAASNIIKIVANPLSRGSFGALLKATPTKAILKGGLKVYSAGTATAGQAAVVGQKGLVLGGKTFKVGKLVGLLGKFAMAHPVVAVGVLAAVAIGGGIAWYNASQRKKEEPQTPNYSSMMPTMG
jgi:hypothetical protein